MTLLIDPPNAPGHGRMWSHLASDSDFEELHRFAAALGIPPRGFDRDHYDIPAERYDDVVAAGAVPVSSRELITRLKAAGLRRRKAEALAPKVSGRSLIRAERLRPGSRVVVVAPAGPVKLDAMPERASTPVEPPFIQVGATVTCSPGSKTPLTFDGPELATSSAESATGTGRLQQV